MIYFLKYYHLSKVNSLIFTPSFCDVEDGVKCPTKVDKTNWLGDNNHDDKFSVAQDGNRVTVTRTDQNGGWGMNLKFICCPEDGNTVF